MAARWSTPSGEQWAISHGSQRAVLVEVGGGVREYTVDGAPVLDGYPEGAVCSRAAGQLLAPWPNRIRDGRYDFGGVPYQLSLSEPARGNASHGLVRWLCWHRVDQTPESVELACVLPPQPGYPFALGLTTRWSLGPDGLRADHTVANLGVDPAPFGLGTHPYLSAGDAVLDELELTLPAAERLLVDDRMLPTGREPVPGTPHDFATPRRIGDAEFDTAYTGLTRGDDGLARTRLAPDGGGGVELWQDASFGWIQVYSGGGPSGRRRGALAVEPMTCPPDAFRSGDGLLTLDPGARWSGSWGITPLR
jgi:aldose 1-epimerase